VALTLTPMMCSTLLQHQAGHGRLYLFIERMLVSLTTSYRNGLARALRHRLLVVLLGLVVAASSGVLFKIVKSELAPLEDRGVIYGMLNGPEGATIDYMLQSVERVERLYESVPEMEASQSFIGFPTVTDGIVIMRLKPWEQRDRAQQSIASELQPHLAALSGVKAYPVNPPSLGQRSTSKPIDFVIMSQVSYPEMDRMVNEFVS